MDIYLHHGARWHMDLVLSYVGGHVHIIEDFDADFLSIINVKDVYKSKLGYKNVEHIYVLEPRTNINEGLLLVQDDNEIRKVLSKINADTYVLEFFTNHEIDALVFAQNILAISYEIDPPIEESGSTDNDAQFLDINELAENDEVESNDSEDDVAHKSNEDNDADSEESKEKNESANNDSSLLMSDYEEVPIERKHLAHFNIEDQRPYFSLGMAFANAAKVRESITKYCISRGVALKFVKNERNRIRVKCQD